MRTLITLIALLSALTAANAQAQQWPQGTFECVRMPVLRAAAAALRPIAVASGVEAAAAEGVRQYGARATVCALEQAAVDAKRAGDAATAERVRAWIRAQGSDPRRVRREGQIGRAREKMAARRELRERERRQSRPARVARPLPPARWPQGEPQCPALTDYFLTYVSRVLATDTAQADLDLLARQLANPRLVLRLACTVRLAAQRNPALAERANAFLAAVGTAPRL